MDNTSNFLPFIFARATEESQNNYLNGRGELVIKDWVVCIATPDFTVYNSTWMRDENLGSFCLIPDVDISHQKSTHATFEEARQAVKDWWVKNA